MTITAKIVADSISPLGIRLTTMQLRYPKFIHGEFMTHRVFSRNASSSRAIPVKKLIEDVARDPAVPIYWGGNKPGMQAGDEHNDPVKHRHWGYGERDESWLKARNEVIEWAQAFAEAGYHKQIVNRLLEPFCHINVVVTATEWANFFALRRHPDAQPEMCALANAMWEAREASVPVLQAPGDWHQPYVADDDPGMFSSDFYTTIKLSVARCARVSYLTHEGKTPSVDDDLKLYGRLVGNVPLHASPCEHQATPDWRHSNGEWAAPETHGNFTGWRQYRRMLPNESVSDR